MRWIFYLLGVVAVGLGVVLTAMYVRAAQRLYAQDREHSPWQRGQGQAPAATGESHSGQESSGPAA